ncbi:hypothetical protein BD410DRAFT_474338 [Rickenella mellea]|uniref:F-box domain-containing protein n=1 Tax=Rickenella mellea TaxID=50990 RepID=A0A4Y7QGX0_9AGAM|nr:hypothetical protein BD410DRAFT_474338 [Rickenella mellea]
MDGIRFIPNHGSMNNVRILRMSFSTIDEYLHCLDVFPSASEVEFDFSGDFHLQPSARQSMRILSSVMALTLRVLRWGDEPQSLGKFLALLQVPNMKELYLALSHKSQEEWMHASEFIERSSPPLVSFKAYGNVVDNYFFQCLRHLSHVQSLSTMMSMFENEKLSLLIERPKLGQSYACPKLQEIHLEGLCPRLIQVPPEFAAFVLHRWYCSGTESDPPSRIYIVTLCTMFPKDSRPFQPFLDYPGVRQCMEDGLQVHLLDRYNRPIDIDSHDVNPD